jgi:RND family efflux transporter MFP subunit
VRLCVDIGTCLRLCRPILPVVTPFLIACGSAPTVTTTTVSRGSVEATVTGVNSGTVKAEQIAELAFGAVGRVKLVSASVGDAVGKGAILAEIENEDLKSRLDVATEELMRAKTLERSRAASRSNVIQAQGEYDAARVAYEKSIIRAPFEGIVVERNVEAGQLSQITAVIPLAPFRLVDTQQRYVEVEIDEVDLPKVTVGMQARVKILAVRREPFKAMVRKVIPFVSSVREQDRTSQIELDVEGEGVLLPAGASADVEIVTSVQNGTLLTTPKAVLGRGGDRYVFTVESGRLHKVPVKVGISGYTATELLKGVSEGTVIALPSDKFEFREGLKVQSKTS